jgi:methylated-DNA-[protein]-cysteine S-methyltransferase
MITYIEHASPLGTIQIAATASGICGVYFEQHAHFKGSDGWQRRADNPLLQLAAQQLDAYFAGQRQSFELPLDLSGTDFQQSVWRQLRKIPYGGTINYAQLAQRIDNPKAVRAVAAANGRNTVSIITPCHRVIGSNGDLTGYAGGLERKRYLLALENNRQIVAGINGVADD